MSSHLLLIVEKGHPGLETRRSCRQRQKCVHGNMAAQKNFTRELKQRQHFTKCLQTVIHQPNKEVLQYKTNTGAARKRVTHATRRIATSTPTPLHSYKTRHLRYTQVYRLRRANIIVTTPTKPLSRAPSPRPPPLTASYPPGAYLVNLSGGAEGLKGGQSSRGLGARLKRGVHHERHLGHLLDAVAAGHDERGHGGGSQGRGNGVALLVHVNMAVPGSSGGGGGGGEGEGEGRG